MHDGKTPLEIAMEREASGEDIDYCDGVVACCVSFADPKAGRLTLYAAPPFRPRPAALGSRSIPGQSPAQRVWPGEDEQRIGADVRRKADGAERSL